MASDGGFAVRLAQFQARARERAARGSAAAADVEIEDEELTLDEVLEHFRLSKFREELEEAGVERVSDIEYIGDSDLEKIGMPMIHRRKLLQALGRDWQTASSGGGSKSGRGRAASGRGSGGGAAGGAAAYAGAASVGHGAAPSTMDGMPPVGFVFPQSDSYGVPRQERQESNPETEAEIQMLIDDVEALIEDFSEVNGGLDTAARGLLSDLPPRVALRAMGILGRGNAFLMHGVRRPAAAVNSRSRTAASDVQSGRMQLIPFEDWRRFVEDFCHANQITEALLELARSLSRDQALKVMGFTSGLRFMIRLEGAELELEVRSRISAALSGDPMTAFTLGPGSSKRPFFAPELQGRVVVPMPIPERDQQPARERSRSRRRHRSDRGHHRSGGDMDFRGGGEDVAPYWQQNMKDFIEINNLDSRSSQALMELDKMAALHVMGLVGRENSFVIRGVRNTSASVMQRLAKAQTGHFGSSEPYQQLSRLLEDFIEMNKIDERGSEVLRTLRSDALLQVLGLTAENAFLISGVRNPSAALMARVTAAQRRNRK